MQIFALLNRVLSRLPLNGFKTNRGLVVFALGTLVALIGQQIGYEPTDQEIELAISTSLDALNMISQALQAFGLSLSGIGFIHKVIKWFDNKPAI